MKNIRYAPLKLSILLLMLMTFTQLSAQENCADKLNAWNEKQDFPSGVVEDYTKCAETVEQSLNELEAQIIKLQKERNATIGSLEKSFEALEEHFKSEDRDDIAKTYKTKKNSLLKQHKKTKI